MSSIHALEVTDINKQFNGVTVLKNINFVLGVGRILGLVGQNGAGKSTLMKILAGVYQRDAGTIKIHGREVVYHTPIAALKNELATIHQELSLCRNLSIAENIFLGDYTKSRVGILNPKELNEQASRILADMGIELNPKTLVKDLPISQQQIVEIAKAYRRSPRILILDEPTSALNITEKESLYKVMKNLQSKNTSMIFISHYLDELMELCDDVLVLRDGQVVRSGPVSSVTMNQLVKDMINTSMSSFYPDIKQRKKRDTTEKELQIKDLQVENRIRKIGPVSFEVGKGEIIGLAGFEGSGHHEIARALAGLIPYKGQIQVSGNTSTLNGPRAAMKEGISYVPSDRKQEGLVLTLSSYKNTAMPILKKLKNWAGVITDHSVQQTTHAYLHQMNIVGDLQGQTMNLSGGNQQKVVLAKMTNKLINPKILILHEPTRGIDIRSKSDIYDWIVQLAEAGTAVIIVTTDLEEVVAMSDRIVVFRDGECIAQDGQFGSKAELQYFIESEAGVGAGK